MRLRRVSALDFYTVTFGLSFLCHRGFGLANEGARVDL
jgi:hypothetical protein